MTKRFPWLLVIILTLIIISAWIVIFSPTIPLIKRDFKTKLGLDLVGGVQALLQADLPASQITEDAMNKARDIVESRVNSLGVSEAIVQRAGANRIVVEIPGETDPETALKTIRETALLEFVDFSQLTPADAQVLEQAGTKIKTDFTSGSNTEPITSTTVISPTSQLQDKIYHTVMTGKDLKSARVEVNQTGQYVIRFDLTPEGSTVFGNFTASNVGNMLAIVLDNKVISAPRIDSAITGGTGIITGNFDVESANRLAIQLGSGSLPVPLKIEQSQAIGPTLGQDSLQKSLVAGTIGILIVMIYMALYYRLPGLIADVALLIYILLTFGLFKIIGVTLTLPGIAGFILSVGVAVDANILIFERLKEELRAGRTLSQGIDTGWKRAWSSIRDSNISTLITCTILYVFGSTFGASIVKGFSVTLAIGVLVSMFTAIIVTRTILHLVLDNIEFAGHKALFGVQEA